MADFVFKVHVVSRTKQYSMVRQDCGCDRALVLKPPVMKYFAWAPKVFFFQTYCVTCRQIIYFECGLICFFCLRSQVDQKYLKIRLFGAGSFPRWPGRGRALHLFDFGPKREKSSVCFPPPPPLEICRGTQHLSFSVEWSFEADLSYKYWVLFVWVDFIIVLVGFLSCQRKTII